MKKNKSVNWISEDDFPTDNEREQDIKKGFFEFMRDVMIHEQLEDNENYHWEV